MFTDSIKDWHSSDAYKKHQINQQKYDNNWAVCNYDNEQYVARRLDAYLVYEWCKLGGLKENPKTFNYRKYSASSLYHPRCFDE